MKKLFILLILFFSFIAISKADWNNNTGVAGTPNSNVYSVQGISGSTPIPISPAAPTSSTPLITGQVSISSTGTAVVLSSSSNILLNGLIITAGPSNNSTCGTIGIYSVTNTVNGTGNGEILCPGGSVAVGSGTNLNTLYVNGTSGDVFSYIGN